MTELAATDPRALLDSLRRVTGDGSERWSARDLQRPWDYDQWRRFEDAIERARAACANVGADPDYHFAASGKVTEGGRWGTHTVPDYLMTRYGAYLLAMNSDPRKPIIAFAQTYFATQTRIAETAMPEQRPAPRRELSNRELAAMVLEEADRADAAEEGRLAEAEQRQLEAARAEQAETRAAELEPDAAAFKVVVADGHDYKVEDVAKVLQREHNVDTGPRRLMQALVRMGWIYRAPDGRPRPYQSTITCGRMTQQLKTYEDRKTGEIIHYWLAKVTAKGIADLLKRRDEIEAEQQAAH